MNITPSRSSSLYALAHPLALAAAGTLLLNALVFQRLWPSWWTGKIGDLAWLVVMPLLAAAPLSAAPGLRRLPPRWLIAGVSASVALAYTLAKAWPPANAALLAAGAALGLTLKLRLDTTDLLALPGVFVAAWVFQHPPRQPGRALPAAALVLAALAVVADAAAPTDYGIDCFTRDDAGLIALREINEPSEMPGSGGLKRTVYRSTDGLSWTLDAKTDGSKVECAAFPQWPAQDPSNPKVQLYSVPGQGIYHSSNQGQTLELEQSFKKVPDFTLDAASGNLIFAAGTDGIWVKTRAGQWVQALNLKTP